MTAICANCQIEFQCLKTGGRLFEMTVNGPIAVYSCDVYQCPECLAQVVAGRAKNPLARDAEAVEMYKNRDKDSVLWFLNQRERNTFNAGLKLT